MNVTTNDTKVLSVDKGEEKHTLSNVTGQSANLCKVSRGMFSDVNHHKTPVLSDNNSVLKALSYRDNWTNTPSDCTQVLITALLRTVKKVCIRRR